MQETTESVFAPSMPSVSKSVEMMNPFANSTPLPKEYFTNQTPAENGKIETSTPFPEYKRRSPQEEDLMKVIADAAGGDAQMLEAMKQAAAAEAATHNPQTPVNAEPKSLLYRIGKGAYGVVVFIARLLGVKPINN